MWICQTSHDYNIKIWFLNKIASKLHVFFCGPIKIYTYLKYVWMTIFVFIKSRKLKNLQVSTVILCIIIKNVNHSSSKAEYFILPVI